MEIYLRPWRFISDMGIYLRAEPGGRLIQSCGFACAVKPVFDENFPEPSAKPMVGLDFTTPFFRLKQGFHLFTFTYKTN